MYLIYFSGGKYIKYYLFHTQTPLFFNTTPINNKIFSTHPYKIIITLKIIENTCLPEIQQISLIIPFYIQNYVHLVNLF